MYSGRNPNLLGLKSPPRHPQAHYFALRGYVLAGLLTLLIAARALSRSPLRSEFLILIAAGMILRAAAGACLGIHGNAAQAKAPHLMQNGPYRFSRNPLYLSNLLIGAGILFFANCLPLWLILFTLIALLIHHALLVKWEEQNLSAQWGEVYASYLQSTPRWLGWPEASTPDIGETQAHWNIFLSKVWAWQGRNLIYTVLSVLLIYGVSRWK
jgi:protein-S-isoprenylcysteine O-methyltransferase Ste14